MVEFKGQRDRLLVLLFAVDFADAYRRTLVGRFDEQRQAEFVLHLRKAELLAIGAGQGDERGNRQSGITQQALGDVFVHTGGGPEDVGTDEGQVSHAQHALQRAVFPEGTVNNRENHIDGGQRLAAVGVDQLLRVTARNLRQGDVGRTQGDTGRILRV